MSAELVNEQVKAKKQTGQLMEFVTKYGTVVAILLVTIFFQLLHPIF